jgi:hypothetical protein
MLNVPGVGAVRPSFVNAGDSLLDRANVFVGPTDDEVFETVAKPYCEGSTPHVSDNLRVAFALVGAKVRQNDGRPARFDAEICCSEGRTIRHSYQRAYSSARARCRH